MFDKLGHFGNRRTSLLSVLWITAELREDQGILVFRWFMNSIKLPSGLTGKQWNCIACYFEIAFSDIGRGGSGWVLGKGSLPRRSWATGTGSLGQWLWRRACQNSRSVWTMLSDTWSDFCVVLCGARVGLDDPCGFLPTQDILWF